MTKVAEGHVARYVYENLLARGKFKLPEQIAALARELPKLSQETVRVALSDERKWTIASHAEVDKEGTPARLTLHWVGEGIYYKHAFDFGKDPRSTFDEGSFQNLQRLRGILRNGLVETDAKFVSPKHPIRWTFENIILRTSPLDPKDRLALLGQQKLTYNGPFPVVDDASRNGFVFRLTNDTAMEVMDLAQHRWTISLEGNRLPDGLPKDEILTVLQRGEIVEIEGNSRPSQKRRKKPLVKTHTAPAKVMEPKATPVVAMSVTSPPEEKTAAKSNESAPPVGSSSMKNGKIKTPPPKSTNRLAKLLGVVLLVGAFVFVYRRFFRRSNLV